MATAVRGTHLHTHGENSHDAFGTGKQRAEVAAALGHTHLFLTDHGNMNGTHDHIKGCQEAGVIPGVGIEIYYQHSDVIDKEQPRFHLLVVAMDEIGYQHLCQMVSESNLEQNKYRTYPMVSWGMLQKYQDRLIVLSGCVSSWVSHLINTVEDEAAARAYLQQMQDLMGDRFYLEVQPFEAPGQKRLNEFLIQAGLDYGIDVVMTSDAHFPDMKLLPGSDVLTTYDAFLMAQKLRKGDRASGTMMANYTERYLQTDEQMVQAWQAFMGTDGSSYWAMSNTLARRCNVVIDSTPKMPDLPWLDGADPTAFLAKLVEDGMKQRKVTSLKYQQRANYEFARIKKRNFVNYFLMVWDIVRAAREAGIPIWTRGSGGGSLLAYALWLNDVDPLVHNTSFDRFLPEDKEELPDFDLDMSSKRRGEVVTYAMNTYQGQAYQISTFGRWQTKNLINALKKWLGITDIDMHTLRVVLEDILAIDDVGLDPEQLYTNVKLLTLERRYPGLLAYFCALYGSMNFIGTHAAGLAIVAGDITKYAPVIQYKKKFQIGYEKDGAERSGIIKADLLGVSAMDVITEAEALVRAAFGDEAIPAPHADYKQYLTKKVLDAFAAGDTATIFQLEKWKTQKYFRAMGAFDVNNPEEAFRRIAAVNALIRPGCKAEGTDELYIKAVQTKKPVQGLWAKFAQDTMGTFLYQEQLVDLCLYAGLDWGDIGKVLKFLKKKDPNHKISAAIITRFIDGMELKGHTRKEAAETFKHMLVYLFNRAHAVSYALMSIRMMYLKQHFPLYWYTAVLNNEQVKVKRDLYLADAKQHFVRILNPHVNGGSKFRVALNGKYLQVGLVSIDGVGPVIAGYIDEERLANGRFTSIADFEERMQRMIPGTGKKEVKQYPGIGEALFTTLGKIGALEFNAKRFEIRTEQYNKQLGATTVLMH